MVAGELVVVGVVEIHAFGRFFHSVAINNGIVGIVEHDALVYVVVGHVVAQLDVGGKHDGIANFAVGYDVAFNLAVVGVHIMHTVAQVVEMVVAKRVEIAGVGKNAVAPVRNVVVNHFGIGRVPHGYAVAALVFAQFFVADDGVALHQRIGRAPKIHAHRVIQNVVFHDMRGISGFVQKNARVHIGQADARFGYGEVLDGYMGRGNGNGAPRAVALDNGIALVAAFQRERFVDDDFTCVSACGQAQGVARLGLVNRGLQIRARAHGDNGGLGGCRQPRHG